MHNKSFPAPLKLISVPQVNNRWSKRSEAGSHTQDIKESEFGVKGTDSTALVCGVVHIDLEISYRTDTDMPPTPTIES